MKYLAVVFWNPDEITTKAATTLHIVKGEPNPTELKSKDGKSIAEFFKNQGFSIQQVMKAFPSYIVPEEDKSKKKLSWKTPLRKQTLPDSETGLQDLADMISMPVVAFVYFRHRDQIPHETYRVGPTT